MFLNVNQVEIIGQVKAPGVYHFNEGMQLQDLIDSGFLARLSKKINRINRR